MRIDYKEHYNSEYFTGKKKYFDAAGNEQTYHGPSLVWDGFQTLAEALVPLLPGRTILDIGCASGDFVSRMAKLKGYDPYGVEVSEYAVKNCVPSMKGRIALADITTCPKNLGPTLFLNSTKELTTVNPTNGKFAKPWPETFDIVMSTDLLEHIYLEDLDKTFDWMMSKTNRFMFFLVAVTDGEEFVHKKGEEVPLRWQTTAVSGHVHVKNWRYWVKYFTEKGLKVRWDLGYLFQMAREKHPDLRNTGGWAMPSTYILEKKK